MGLYAPEQHELYDGKFRIRGTRVYQVGTLNDESPWDHMGDDADNLRPVRRQVELDVDEIENNHPNREVFDHFFAIEVTWR